MLNWEGDTVICAGSGPSLTKAQCIAAVSWQTASSRHHIVVTNTTFKAIPTADVLFFMDQPWYRHYKDELDSFSGLLVTTSPQLPDGIWHPPKNVVPYACNSGAGAVHLAHYFGAKKAILLGMDCTFKVLDDKESWHWHGDHPGTLENGRGHYRWPTQFERLLDLDIEIVNCSQDSALTCFPKLELDDVIGY